MQPTRRSVLGWGLTGSLLATGVSGGSVSAPSSGKLVGGGFIRDQEGLLSAIKAAMVEELGRSGAPGMTLALTAPSGFGATLVAGYADLAARAPVLAEHRFQIGSISKAFLALAVYILADRELLALNADVRSLLPDVEWPDQAITIEQLLNHSSGLPTNAPIFPRTTSGKLWTGYAPGTRFSYCNTGYNILAFVVAKVTGKAFPEALKTLVLDPLAMNAAKPAILTADRTSYPTSYIPLEENLPYFAGNALAPAPWLEDDIGAGSIGATAADMVRFIAFLARASSGDFAPLLRSEQGRRWLTPVIAAPQFGDGVSYANGLAIQRIGSDNWLSHTGGTYSYSSAHVVNMTSRVGCFASVNFGRTPYRPKAFALRAAQMVEAVILRKALPVSNAATAGEPDRERGRTGTYASPELGMLKVLATADGLTVEFDGQRWRTARISSSDYWVRHPRLGEHYLSFDGPGELWWGGLPLGRGGASVAPASSPALAQYAGRYRNNDPWWDPVSIVVRSEKLIMEGSGELVRHGDGSWRFADPALAMERIWFDAPLNQQMSRLSFSGNDFIRNVAYPG